MELSRIRGSLTLGTPIAAHRRCRRPFHDLVLLRFSRPLWATLLVGALLVQASAHADTLILAPADTRLVGAVRYIKSRTEDTLVDLALLHGQGYDEMRSANPTVDAWLPGQGTVITIPSQYLLPDAVREGIIVNLAEMRLYYYPTPGLGVPPSVITYPIGIGRDDWPSPTGATKIIQKIPQPAWHPPASIRAEHAAQGRPLPAYVPPGPDNPLGQYAMRLGFSGYLLHGTNKHYGVGMRVSHGCIRLYPADIEALFAQVPNGTRVELIDKPYKAAVQDGRLYVEVHQRYNENGITQGDFTALLEVVHQTLAEHSHLLAGAPNLAQLPAIYAQASGIPVALEVIGGGRPAGDGHRLTQADGTEAR
jgi:L,D-transpeptidase ErfK/SrfK